MQTTQSYKAAHWEQAGNKLAAVSVNHLIARVP
jgi:hypothetical protein